MVWGAPIHVFAVHKDHDWHLKAFNTILHQQRRYVKITEKIPNVQGSNFTAQRGISNAFQNCQGGVIIPIVAPVTIGDN